jgi:hypothetical protein
MTRIRNKPAVDSGTIDPLAVYRIDGSSGKTLIIEKEAAMLIQFTPLVSGLYVLAAATGGTPTVDIRKTCQESEKAVTAIFGNATVATYDNCVSQEQAARASIVKDWAKYTAQDKELCINTTGYMPSYVEWLTCLEMAGNLRESRKAQPTPVPFGGDVGGDSPNSRTGSKTKQCPIVQMRADGSIVYVIAC